eukprot:11158766-Lingulodinium_polyedra.AAC.1
MGQLWPPTCGRLDPTGTSRRAWQNVAGETMDYPIGLTLHQQRPSHMGQELSRPHAGARPGTIGR